ncbi:MAG: DUF3168 domain-containing protein [Devosia sp.]
MSTAPDEEIIAAAIVALKADAALVELVGGRIYDRVPEKAAGKTGVEFPYISLGPTSSLAADVNCSDAEEITLQFDVWSRGDGIAYDSREVRRIVRAIRRVLSDAELVLDDAALVTMTYELNRVLREADGATNHGLIQFVAVVESP